MNNKHYPSTILKQGFTIIELILVIAIIGILAVTAFPKYISITSNAETNATKAVAGNLSSANAENYAARSTSVALGTPVANCTDVSSLLSGGLPSGYTITAAVITVNTTISCTVTGPGAVTATFTATGIQ